MPIVQWDRVPTNMSSPSVVATTSQKNCWAVLKSIGVRGGGARSYEARA